MIGRLIREYLARRWAKRRTPSHILLGHGRIEHLPLGASHIGKLSALAMIEATDRAHGALRHGAKTSSVPT